MKDVVIRTRITKKQCILFTEAATQLEMNLSKWIRETLISSIKTKPVETQKALLIEIRLLQRELNLIGNNINQIARYANTNREFRSIECALDSLQRLASNVRVLNDN
ncbi:hypothetical protein ABIE64_001078 [Thalassospira sp. MBR-102]